MEVDRHLAEVVSSVPDRNDPQAQARIGRSVGAGDGIEHVLGVIAPKDFFSAVKESRR